MMLHAWKGYKTYAWGADELKPISKSKYNWYHGGSLLKTAVDSLSTLHIMDLMDEYNDAKRLILDSYANIRNSSGLPEFMHDLKVIIRFIVGLFYFFNAFLGS